MERSSLQIAQQAAVGRFVDPRAEQRRQREQQLYEAARHRVQAPSRLNTGASHFSQRSSVPDSGAVDVDWAGNILRRRQRKRVSPTRAESMQTVLTTPANEQPKPFKKQFHEGGRDLRFASYGKEAEGMPLNSAAYQLSAGEAHSAAHWRSSTQASIMDKQQASLDDLKKPKGKRIIKPAFENAAARIAQSRNQDLLLGNRKKKANGPMNFLEGIYKSVAASTANLKPRPATDPGGGPGRNYGRAQASTMQDLDEQIQRASKFLSPTVYNAAKSSATSPRRNRGRNVSTLNHRIW